MVLAIETIAGRAVNPGAALPGLQLTNDTGSTFTVRSANETGKVTLQDMWAKGLAGGVFNIHSPWMHKTTTGLSFSSAVIKPIGIYSLSPAQTSVPNDPLLAFITG